MPAGPEVPQPGTIQATGYTPVKTELAPPIQLPGTGELWANVGKTAMDAAGVLQKSALNPAVHEQMKYDVAQYKAAQDHIDYLKSLGPLGHMTGTTGPQGYSTAPISSIQDPTLATRMSEAMTVTPKTGTKVTGPAPNVNDGKTATTAPPAPSGDNQSFEGSEYPAQPSQPQQPQQPQEKKPPTAAEMGKPVTSASSVFSAPIAQAAPAPTDFSNQLAQFNVPSKGGDTGSLSASTDNDFLLKQQKAKKDQELAQWQTQTQTEPMTADDAMAWMRRQTTLAQDATYMPHGGPGGSPAFAFHMKTPGGGKGGVNMVPLSQMVANGAGPTVAAQNTSAVLSKSDQIKQQQQDAAAQQVAPTIASDQGAPPPAPAPTIASDQGQPPPAPGNYDPTPYRQAVAQAIANPQNLAAEAGQRAGTRSTDAQPPPGTPINPPPSQSTVSKEDQDANQAAANQMPPPPSNQSYTGDRKIEGTSGPYTYYINDDPNSTSRGRAYTVLPGPAGHYFDQQRWYLGSDKYERYELPDSAAKQQMWDKWGANGYLSRDEIAAMDKKQMEPWLQRAWQNENFTRSSPTDKFNSDLDSSEQLHNYLKKISDLEHTLAESGYPTLSSLDKLRASGKNAAVSLGVPHGVDLGPLHLSIPAGTMDSVAAGGIRELDQTINQAQELLKAHPELLLSPGEGGGQETPNIHVGEWVRMGLPNVPASTILNDSAWSGQDIATKTRNLDGLRKVADLRYKDLVTQGQNQWMKIADKHDANLIKLDQGRDLPDPRNPYAGHRFTVDQGDYQEFAREHPNTPFLTSDGKPMRTPK